MKSVTSLVASLLVASLTSATAFADHYVRPGYPPPRHHDHDGDIALFATTTAAFLITLSHADAHHYHSLMVEAAPLAADYLSTGQGLENQALVAAMILVQNGDKSISNDELALRVIEEANK